MTDWRAEMASQNDYLGAQLKALRAVSRRDPKRWRKWRLLVVLCRYCGCAFVEVMNLDPCAVILTRGTVDHPSTPAVPAGATVEDYIQRLSSRIEPIRLDRDWRFFPIAWPLRERDRQHESRQLVSCTCKCRHFTLNTEVLYDALRDGRTKIVLPTRAQGQQD